MKLEVKTLAGHSFSVEFNLEDAVLEVKQKIAARTDLPEKYDANLIKLLYGGVALDDEMSMAAYSMEESGHLVLLKLKPGRTPTPKKKPPPSLNNWFSFDPNNPFGGFGNSLNPWSMSRDPFSSSMLSPFHNPNQNSLLSAHSPMRAADPYSRAAAGMNPPYMKPAASSTTTTDSVVDDDIPQVDLADLLNDDEMPRVDPADLPDGRTTPKVDPADLAGEHLTPQIDPPDSPGSRRTARVHFSDLPADNPSPVLTESAPTRRAEHRLSAFYSQPVNHQARQEDFQSLLEMGYSRKAAEEALRNTTDLDTALEYLNVVTISEDDPEPPSKFVEPTTPISESRPPTISSPRSLPKSPPPINSATKEIKKPRSVKSSRIRVVEDVEDDESLSDMKKTPSSMEKTPSGMEKTTSGMEKTTSGMEKTTFGMEKTTFGMEKTTFGMEKTTFGMRETTFGVGKTPLDTEKTSFDIEKPVYDEKDLVLNVDEPVIIAEDADDLQKMLEADIARLEASPNDYPASKGKAAFTSNPGSSAFARNPGGNAFGDSPGNGGFAPRRQGGQSEFGVGDRPFQHAGGSQQPERRQANRAQLKEMGRLFRSDPNAFEQWKRSIQHEQPDLAQVVARDPEQFIRFLENGGEQVDGPVLDERTIYLTPEDQQVITRLEAMGFERTRAIEAYMCCDQDEEAAVNYLLS